MRRRVLAIRGLAVCGLLLGGIVAIPTLALGTAPPERRGILARASMTMHGLVSPTAAAAAGALPGVPAQALPAPPPVPLIVPTHNPAPQPPPHPLPRCASSWVPPIEGALHFRTSYRSPNKGTFKHCPKWSGFGQSRGHRFHGGVDISAPTNTPVHAAADGTLSYSRDPGGYGLYAKVKFHPRVEKNNSGTCTDNDEHEIIYAHLIDDNRKLSMGPRPVRAGEVIGRVGCTGNAKGMCSPSPESHVHVTVNRLAKGKKQPIDPTLIDGLAPDDARRAPTRLRATNLTVCL
ncbi:MAG: M23 family metallopeptidase [Polyangiaceae bacterium]